MKTFRSNIWVLFASVLLLTGLTAQGVGSYEQRDAGDELTRWLSDFAYESYSDDAYEKLRSIAAQTSSEKEFIERASDLMLAHPDLFNIPQNSEKAPDSLNQTLYLQWTNQQAPSGMNSSAQVERTRNLTGLNQDAPSRYTSTPLQAVLRRAADVIKSALPEPADLLKRLLEPLSDGLAINAP